jgi:chromosome segregation ATPase
MLRKIKSLFIVDDSKLIEKETSGSKKTESETWPESTGIKKTSPLGSAKVSELVPDEKFLDILVDVLEKNNQEGFDYLEYKQSLASLKEVGLDEKTRYQSALAMAQTMGVNAEQLYKSAEIYLNILAGEEQKFQEAVKGQRQRLENDQKNKPANLLNRISEKEKKINELKIQIDTLKSELDTVQKELVQSEERILDTEQNFKAAYLLVSGQIQKDVENMKNYL